MTEHRNKTLRSKCWPWWGTCTAKGYGRYKKNGKQAFAHRMMYEAFKGRIPKGSLVLHKCDNPPCVNPKHLFLGSHMDNHLDKIAKNRQRFVGRPSQGKWTREYLLKKSREYGAVYRAKMRLKYGSTYKARLRVDEA